MEDVRSSLFAPLTEDKSDVICRVCSLLGVIEEVVDTERWARGADTDAGSGEELRASDTTKLGAAILTDVGVKGSRGFPKRPADDIPGDFFDGRVLLLWTPLPGLLPVYGEEAAGVIGFGTLMECFDCLDETDTFRLIPPNLRRLSAPALALDADRPKAAFRPFGMGPVGVVACGDGAPLWTSLTVCSSAAVPVMPIKKLS